MDKNCIGKIHKKIPVDVILHVGLHKTATSSIQETLKLNAAYFEEEGYLYPCCWQANHSEPVYGSFCDHPESYHANIKDRVSESEIKKIISYHLTALEEEIAAKDFSTLIISGEDISVLSEKGLRKLKKYLGEVLNVDDIVIKVLIYVRHPVPWVVSLLQEEIKGGGSYQTSFETIEKILGNHFEDCINKFVKVFGQESVDVVAFEEAITHKCGPVGFFLAKLDFAQEDIEKFQIIKSNVSISLVAANIISYINEEVPMIDFGRLNDRRKNQDCAPLYNVGGPKFDISEEDKKKISDISRADRIWLKENWGIVYSDIIQDTTRPSIEFTEEIINEIKISFFELTEPLQELILEYFHDQHKKSLSAVEKDNIKKLLQELRQIHYDKITQYTNAIRAKEMVLAEYIELNQKLQSEIEQHKQDLISTIHQKEDLTHQLTDMSAYYHWMRNSNCWRMTKPLRLMLDFIKKLF